MNDLRIEEGKKNKSSWRDDLLEQYHSMEIPHQNSNNNELNDGATMNDISNF